MLRDTQGLISGPCSGQSLFVVKPQALVDNVLQVAQAGHLEFLQFREDSPPGPESMRRRLGLPLESGPELWHSWDKLEVLVSYRGLFILFECFGATPSSDQTSERPDIPPGKTGSD